MPGATTSRTNEFSRSGASSGRGELVAKIGTVISAIMASSCCWLPGLLLAVGVSGAGIASALAAYRPAIMVVTFGFLGMAFYFTYRPRHAARGQADCCSPQAAPTDAPQAEADCCSRQAVDGGQAVTATRWSRFDMMALNKLMLWAVTVLAIVFLFFPQYVTGLLGSGNEQISAEMTRSVIKIEGMTCEG
ncbi:MAG: hypothetical protein HY000_23300 [Planctomycetes bacterium]|nr:hypothetical protein [Planctomycetota bacterium]